jgi:hypothetical protein
MTNIALFNPSNAPSFARNHELSETAKALTGGGVGNSSQRISIKGGVFRLLAGGKEIASIDERFLDVIIVKAAPKVSRIFYAKSYDGDNITGPDCWSNDGERPDASAENKQGTTCMSCPQNIAGSGQGNSRACRYQQRLAVVLENNIEGDILQLTLPATSVFGKEDGDKRPLQAFARNLALQNPPISPEMIVTRMKFDTKAEAPKLHFAPSRWLTDEEYAIVKTQGDSDEAKRAVVMTVAAADGVKTAPKLAIEGKRPAPVEEPPEVAEMEAMAEAKYGKPAKAKAKPAEVEEDAEPEVRKEASKPSAVPAKKGKLADIVSDWDDE